MNCQAHNALRSLLTFVTTSAWGVNLALCVVTLASALVLSFYLKKENKKMEELEADGYTLEAGDVEGKSKAAAHHHEHPTAGRPLGGAGTGKLAKYQT